MLNITLCDDDSQIRQQLTNFICRFQEKKGIQIQICAFSSGTELLARYPHGTDILLLDIEMHGIGGLEAARRIKAAVPDICIIFITNHAQYALKSYSTRAFGFLTKPLSYPVFQNELALAAEQLFRQNSHCILVKDQNTMAVHKVDVKDISYFEVRNHSICAVTEKQKLYYRGTLNTVEQELSSYGFFRCHSAFLVNQRYISSIKQDLVMLDGTVIPISRPKRKEFLSKLAGYVGEIL